MNFFNDKWVISQLPNASFKFQEVAHKIDCSNIVAIGSCFSRNFSRWLAHHKIQECDSQVWGVFYNAFTIYSEFERLFEDFNWKEFALKEFEPRNLEIVYRDPCRTWLYAKNIDLLKELNAAHDVKARDTILNGNSYLFTLGLSEIWSHKNVPSLVLNCVPVKSIKPEEWYFRMASIEENYDILKLLVNLLSSIKPNCLIIFTLSPVPLKHTASENPIAIANNISKSHLLVAIHKICNEFSNVCYYPSYEIVFSLMMQGHKVWQIDGRHITASTVNIICKEFINWTSSSSFLERDQFWVPQVDKEGAIVGKLFVDDLTEEFL